MGNAAVCLTSVSTMLEVTSCTSGNCDSEADALRIARGMTYKNAMAEAIVADGNR